VRHSFKKGPYADKIGEMFGKKLPIPLSLDGMLTDIPSVKPAFRRRRWRRARLRIGVRPAALQSIIVL
jgi:hypothetical protein